METTDSPHPPAPTLSAAAVRSALEAAGCRCTHQRLAVYDALAHADHPTAEQLFEAVRGVVPNISLATVYKALEALVRSGLAAKLAAEGGSARYDARPDAHYHLRCTRSGRVEDVASPFDPELPAKLDANLGRLLEERGFRLTGYRLELLGEFEAGIEATPVPNDDQIESG